MGNPIMSPQITYYTSYDQLPLTLSAPQAAKVMGISVPKMYQLMHSCDFPTMFIGKRMLVNKDALIKYMKEHTRKTSASPDVSRHP